MAAVFTLFCTLIAAVNGRHLAVLGEQRSELRESADLLRIKNERLRRLEQANRRATRFLVHDLKGAPRWNPRVHRSAAGPGRPGGGRQSR
jgi:hypothetical protein